MPWLVAGVAVNVLVLLWLAFRPHHYRYQFYAERSMAAMQEAIWNDGQNDQFLKEVNALNAEAHPVADFCVRMISMNYCAASRHHWDLANRYRARIPSPLRACYLPDKRG